LIGRATLTQGQRGTALALRGTYYWRAHHHEQTIADFDQALRLRPYDHNIHVQRARTYKSLANYDRALADLEEALRVHPDVAEWRTDRSILLIRMGRQDEAMEDFERLAEAHPKEAARILVERGSTHNKLGQLDEAMRALDRAIALNPSIHDAWMERGWTFRETATSTRLWLTPNVRSSLRPSVAGP
jgi:tetratricopeptide (TPR) repeat protein